MVGEGLQALMEQGMRELLVRSLVRECVYAVHHTAPYIVLRCVIACAQGERQFQRKKTPKFGHETTIVHQLDKIPTPTNLSQRALKLPNPGSTGGTTASGGTPLAGGARGEGGASQPGNPGSALIGVCEGGDS